MIRVYPKKTKDFIFMSKDNNKIHFDNNFAKKYFFKKPILHGMNVVLSAFEIFFKYINHNCTLEELKIDFKNFCLSDEKIYMKYKNNKISILGKINHKIEINFKLKKKIKNKYSKKTIQNNLYNFYNLTNPDLLFNCVYLSKFVGTKNPGNGSLIHRLSVSNCSEKDEKFQVKKIVRNIKEIQFKKSFKNYTVLCSKIKQFKQFKVGNKKNELIHRNLYNKRILIFGKKSDLGLFTFNLLQKYNCKINSHSFRLNLDNPIINKKIFNPIKNEILNNNPDYIFYFSSPEITTVTRNIKATRQLYDRVYIDLPKLICNLIIANDKNTKLFMPSTIFLNNFQKYPHLTQYINSKKNMELTFKKKKYSSLVNMMRLPQFKTKSNYNILGFYEGISLNYLKNFIYKFINKSHE